MPGAKYLRFKTMISTIIVTTIFVAIIVIFDIRTRK